LDLKRHAWVFFPDLNYVRLPNVLSELIMSNTLVSSVLKLMIAGASQDVLDKYGDVRDEKFFMDLFKDPPALCGQTCAFLASGRGKELRGLYLGMLLNYHHCVSIH
jgi:hypothetical protein